MSYFADEDLYRRFEKQNYVLSFIYCHGICVYIFSSLSIARLMRRWSSCRRKFHGKGIKWKTFPNDYAASLCGVVVGCSRVESTVPGSNLTVLYIPSFFFSCLMHSFPPSFIYLFILSILLTLQTWGKLCLPQLQDRDPGGGLLLGILGGGVPTGFPILTLFKTRKCHFSHPFSDRAFKKLCHPSYLD